MRERAKSINLKSYLSKNKIQVIFLTNSTKSAIRDFSMPFSTIKNLELKQPMFGQNHIIGNVNAAPGGKFSIALIGCPTDAYIYRRLAGIGTI